MRSSQPVCYFFLNQEYGARKVLIQLQEALDYRGGDVVWKVAGYYGWTPLAQVCLEHIFMVQVKTGRIAKFTLQHRNKATVQFHRMQFAGFSE